MLALNKVYFTAPGGEDGNGALRNIIDGIDFTLKREILCHHGTERQRENNARKINHGH